MAYQPYAPPLLMKNGHVQTIYPVMCRTVNGMTYQRERITTPDGDFLDLDWSRVDSRRLAVVSHGLEGSSSRNYVRGMVKALNRGGWDVLAWNYRSCSGEPNRRLCFYHNGATDDLARVIDHGKTAKSYQEIALVGFSLGGNLTLVHLGRDRVDHMVKKSVVFSVPCDLAASAQMLAKPANKIYMKRFLLLLHQKIKEKTQRFPGEIDDEGYETIKSFKEFDDRYTAPIHGFKDAADYWEKCSSAQFIPEISIPCTIINAANDPFLSGECFPEKQAEANRHVTLQTPESGGHVGFVSFNNSGAYWSEQQAVAFLNS